MKQSNIPPIPRYLDRIIFQILHYKSTIAPIIIRCKNSFHGLESTLIIPTSAFLKQSVKVLYPSVPSLNFQYEMWVGDLCSLLTRLTCECLDINSTTISSGIISGEKSISIPIPFFCLSTYPILTGITLYLGFKLSLQDTCPIVDSMWSCDMIN